MGFARLALYITGLLIVVGAAWIFLTQTEVGQQLPGGLALALILLIVGIGVMASARSIDDRRATRTVTYEGSPDAYAPMDRTVAPGRARIVEERREE